jgi:hypothetical protein
MQNESACLIAPSIPVAEADGLIKTDDLCGDVLACFPLWSGALPGDKYQLVLNELPVGTEEALLSPLPGTGAALKALIPLDAIRADGSYSVGYRVTAFPGGGIRCSKSTTIRIDHKVPGGPSLGPIAFPAISFGALVGELFPCYGMEPGDTIQTLCNETPGPTYCVQPENLTTSPITISFSKEFIDSLLSDTVSLTYYITDRAGNRSTLAKAVELTVQCD